MYEKGKQLGDVSTHSRLKAAGKRQCGKWLVAIVSTHSRLKAAGYVMSLYGYQGSVSTHSRLKAAGAEPARAVGRR